jgi:hypothetical protein
MMLWNARAWKPELCGRGADASEAIRLVSGYPETWFNRAHARAGSEGPDLWETLHDGGTNAVSVWKCARKVR